MIDELVILYKEIEKRLDAGESSADLREMIDAFGEVSRDKASYFSFAGRESYIRGRLKESLMFFEKAYARRNTNVTIWKYLALIHETLGNHEDALIFYGLYFNHEHKALDIKIESAEEFEIFGMGFSEPSFAPIRTIVEPVGKTPATRHTADVGTFLKSFYGRSDYFVGLYNTDNRIGSAIDMYDALTASGIEPICFGHVAFDLIKANLTKEAAIALQKGNSCIIPFATTKKEQRVEISDDKKSGALSMGPAEFKYIRADKNVTLKSDELFAIGSPISVGHSPGRHRLVLDILLDGLAWKAMKDTDYTAVPNLVEFFEKGIIFDESYSHAEYTFPSYASILTGLYMPHSAIVCDKAWAELSKKILTTSEMMKNLGYYCVNLADDGTGIFTGTLRGFDRIMPNHFGSDYAHEAVHRLIDYLEAFHDVDSYVSLHISDPHPYPENFRPSTLKSQTTYPWSMFTDWANNRETNSVFMKSYDLARKENMYRIRRTDALMGIALDYISSRYDEDDYVINVYSDHGSSIYSTEPFIVNDEQTNSAMMMRGACVPRIGHTKELLSAIDLYAIHRAEEGMPPMNGIDANLPAAFGGKERDYAISNSIYPNQTFKLCIRDKTYEFGLETLENTRFDCTVDMRSRVTVLQERSTKKEVHDETLINHFLKTAAEYTASFDHP